jgi:hypothetical protein
MCAVLPDQRTYQERSPDIAPRLDLQLCDCHVSRMLLRSAAPALASSIAL